jgi:hypothetical protein
VVSRFGLGRNGTTPAPCPFSIWRNRPYTERPIALNRKIHLAKRGIYQELTRVCGSAM